MRAPTLAPFFHPLALTAALICCTPALAQAQTPAPAGAPAAATSATEATPAGTNATPANPSSAAALKGDQRIRHIHVEDSGSSINELRYGGNTQSVTVQPKGSALPEYEVLSNDGSRSRPVPLDNNNGPLGPRVWNLFKF